MLFIPLPFVVALLLLLLLVVALRGRDPSKGNGAFLTLVGLCASRSVAVGLRWGYHVEQLRYLLPVLASCLPPLVLASFRSLIHRENGQVDGLRWLHALPPVGVAILLLLAPGLIDAALIALFVGYALAVLNLGGTGPDALDDARFDSAVAAHRALVIAAAALCLSALFDFVVLLDFANLMGLLFIGLTAIVASRAQALPVALQCTADASSLATQDREILDRVNHLLADRKLSRDENLTLSRLARRVGAPARQISGAVNRLAGKNVSQYINDFRIAEACRLLRETDMSVTAAMFESGFQTKSNFNREFRRVTCQSPASWREQNRRQPAARLRNDPPS